jgi:hypothetical protein
LVNIKNLKELEIFWSEQKKKLQTKLLKIDLNLPINNLEKNITQNKLNSVIRQLIQVQKAIEIITIRNPENS